LNPDSYLSEVTLELLEEAWEKVRTKGDASGIDGVDLKLFEDDWYLNLTSLLSDLKSGTYQVQAYKLIEIPKNSGEKRQIVIATVRDRIIQTAVTFILEPVIEAMMHKCCYAYRKGQSIHNAIAKLAEYRNQGYSCVLKTDIHKFFDSIDHSILFGQLKNNGISTDLIDLLKQWLSISVFTDEDKTIGISGLPQGLPFSPLLANFYLLPFDQSMEDKGWSIIRYADDLIICCKTEDEARGARIDAEKALSNISLKLSDEKTETQSFKKGVEFLGARVTQMNIIPAVPHPYEKDFKTITTHNFPKKMKSIIPHLHFKTLYIQTQGARLSCHNERFMVFKNEEPLFDAPARYIDQVFIFGNVHITTWAMAFSLRRNIPIYLFSGKGQYYGVLSSSENSSYFILKRQFSRMDDEKERLQFSKNIVYGKINNYRQFISRILYNHPEIDIKKDHLLLKRDMKRLMEVSKLDEVLGIEGVSTSRYYSILNRFFTGSLKFHTRSRRPPTDPVNSLLSFGYALLLYRIHSCLHSRGLNPSLGLFHKSSRNVHALASDLIEEFRAPIVDSLALSLANNNDFSQEDFYFVEGTPRQCLLKDESRQKYLEAFEQKMGSVLKHPDNHNPVDWRRIIDLQVLRLKRYITGEIKEYIPYKWD